MFRYPDRNIRSLLIAFVSILLSVVLLLAAGPRRAAADRDSFGSDAAKATLIDRVLAGQLDGRRVYVCPEPILTNDSVRAWTGLKEERLTSPYVRGWFFFIDDLAGANWCHRCRYVFVDEPGDRYVVVNGQFPPMLARSSIDRQGKTISQELSLQEIPESARLQATGQSAPEPPPEVQPDPQSEPQPPEFGVPAEEPLSQSGKSTGVRRALLISGGYNGTYNYARYRNDLSHFYVTLKKYGFTDANIIVAYAAGGASDLDNDGDNDIDSNARETSILADIAALPANLDHLVIFVTDHGTTGPLTDGAQSGDSFIICWDDGDGLAEFLTDDGLSDVELTAAVAARSPACVSYLLEQCYSGGFLDNLRNSANEVVMSAACGGNEVSWGCDTEGQFDEFCYHYTSGLRRAQPLNDTAAGICTDGISVKPDNNGNNASTLAWNHAYADNRDSCNETPQFANVPAGHGARSWVGSCPTNYLMLDNSGDRSLFNVGNATSVALVFDTNSSICMNSDLDRQGSDYQWYRQSHWNYNSGQTRTFTPQAGTGWYRLVSCCSSRYNVTAHFDGSGNSTPSSPWDYAGYTLGGIDRDASEFGVYYYPQTFSINDDLQLSQVPRYLGTGYASGMTFYAPYESRAPADSTGTIRLVFAAVGVYPTAPGGQVLTRVLVDSLPPIGSTELSIDVADTARRFYFDLGRLEPRLGNPYAITLEVEDGYIELDGISMSSVTEVGTGPSILAEAPFLAQDAFPETGLLDTSDPCQDWVRFDMAAALHGTPGDSIVFTITCTRQGTRLAALPLLNYILDANPFFDACRSVIPAGSWSGGSNTLTRGAVSGQQVTDSFGSPVPDRYCFDLPDTGFFFPGDIIHYFIEATDTDLLTTLAPADTTSFELFPRNPSYRFQRYSDLYTVRALPSILDMEGDVCIHPEILWWRDCDEEAAQAKWMHAWWDVGASEDRYAVLPYDTYYTQAAYAGVGNGLGSRATVLQLSGYRLIVYSSGDQASYTLAPADSQSADDLSVLDGWLKLGSKAFFASGNGIACDLSRQPELPAKQAFLDDWLHVQLVDCSHIPHTTYQPTSVQAVPFTGNPFHERGLRWAADSSTAPRLGEFDWVRATGSPGKTAAWLTPACTDASLDIAAAVYNIIDSYADHVFYLPYDLGYVVEDQRCGGNPTTGITRSVRAEILADVLDRCGFQPTAPTTDVPQVTTLVTRSYPNPFNPAVTVKYAMPLRAKLTLRIYDLRGKLIRTLLDREVEPGDGMVTWDGTDRRGGRVASGVYFCLAEALGKRIVEKITLVK